MEICGLQKFSLIDYPKKLSCVLFCCGCNFFCPFCHNSQLILKEKIKLLPKIEEKDFLKFLREKKGFLDAVVITGGEPTLQNDLLNFLKKIKKLGFLIKLDTNGSRPEVLKNLIKANLIDYIAMDVKFSPKLYQEILKFDFKKIKESINLIKNSKIDYEFRTTVVPTLHNLEEIKKIIQEISPAKRYVLQNFQPKNTLDPRFEKLTPFSEEALKNFQKVAKNFFEEVILR